MSETGLGLGATPTRAGVHVAYVIVDGGIDKERLLVTAPHIAESAGTARLLHSHATAESNWQLHCQARSAWTPELDLRPFEKTL